MRRDPAVSGTIRLRVVAATPVVFVSGPPASGKTYVADLLAAHLSLPLIAKDRIKETLFDALGTGDTAWSRSLGRATFALLYAALERQLEAGRPVIVEANFDAIHAPAKLAELRRRYDFRPFEVHCTASLEVLRHRYAARGIPDTHTWNASPISRWHSPRNTTRRSVSVAGRS
jgi:predicted kinase